MAEVVYVVVAGTADVVYPDVYVVAVAGNAEVV